jgi:predicted small lipoprotein YifL
MPAHLPFSARNALLILVAGVMLAGCGVRGPLQTPKADANAPATPEATASADSGQGKPANTAAKPHQGFILDGLLR